MQNRKIIGLILAACLGIMVSSAYTDPENRFSVTPPEGWIVNDAVELQKYNARVKFIDPMNAVNEIIVWRFSNYGRSVQDQNTLQNDYYRSLYPDYTVLSKEERTINGIPALAQEAKVTVTGISLREKRVIFDGDRYFYYIELTTLPDNYYAKLPLFEKTVDSFTLMTPTPATPGTTKTTMRTQPPTTTPTLVPTTLVRTTESPAPAPPAESARAAAGTQAQPGFTLPTALIGLSLVSGGILLTCRKP